MPRDYCQTCRGRGRIRGAMGKYIPCPTCTPVLTKAQRAERQAAIHQAYAPRPEDGEAYERYVHNQKLFHPDA